MRLRVGTSGYAYKEWKGEGLFYPPELKPPRMLHFYATHFDTVEINNTFYRMPSDETLANWSEQVPDSFCFVVKASRRITHHSRLGNVEDPVRFLFERVASLGDKLGPVLFQLPPTMRKDIERLQNLLACVPDGRRITLEFRHRSWFDDEVFEALRAHNAALCVTDGEVEGGVPLTATADWGYLRLRDESYDETRLTDWATRIRDQPWSETFVFFKHEDQAVAPRLARQLAELF